MLDFNALSLMVPLLTRCKLCLLKFIQLTENKRKTEYKQSARIMMHRMSNPIVKRLNLTFVFASFISMESASKFGVVPYHLNLHIFLKAKIGGHLKHFFLLAVFEYQCIRIQLLCCCCLIRHNGSINLYLFYPFMIQS